MKPIDPIPKHAELSSYLARFGPVLFGTLCGFSVFYFLYFFEAYGIQRGLSYSGHSHLFRSICFGLLTLTYICLLETWLRPKMKIASKLTRVLWYSSLIILGSHLTFILFNYFWNWQEMSLTAYGLIMKEYPLMMAIPLIIYLLITKNMKPRSSLDSMITFQSDNGKNQLSILLQDFLYANSSDNYVRIAYLSNNTVKQHLIRKPLKTIERELYTLSEIRRTHRSYLINKMNIDSIKQQKGRLSVDIRGNEIPVSKKFENLFVAS